MARPIKGVAFDYSTSLYTTAGALITAPGTITAKVSLDGGAFTDVANITKESVYGSITLGLTAANMDAERVDLMVVDDTADCITEKTTIYTEPAAQDVLTPLAVVDANVDALVAEPTPPTLLEIVNGVWDELLLGTTHNIPASAGRRLRQIASSVVISGVAEGSAINGNQIVLDSDASDVDGAYDPSVISIVAGTGAGQCRLILDYVGGIRTATVDRDWKVLPDSTSEYIIFADAGREHVNEGLVVAATATTITLNSSASPNDDEYLGQNVFIRSGYGADQARRVVEYDGATRTATLVLPWAVIPDSTSAYVMLPQGAMSDQSLAAGILNAVAADYDTGGSIGAAISTACENVAPTVEEIDTELSTNHGAGAWSPDAPTVGMEITPTTLDTDGVAIGLVPPNATLTVWLDDTAWYQFDADADGEYSYRLPYGSIWTITATAPKYTESSVTVSTVQA